MIAIAAHKNINVNIQTIYENYCMYSRLLPICQNFPSIITSLKFLTRGFVIFKNIDGHACMVLIMKRVMSACQRRLYSSYSFHI